MAMLGAGVSIYPAWALKGGVLSPLIDGLVGYWNLDEESGVRADSIGSADLADINTTGFVAGKNGNAASMVAANNESLKSDPLTYDYTGGFTVSCWIKLAVASNYMVGHDLQATRGAWNFYLGTLYVLEGGNPGNFLTVATTVPDGAWAHLLGWWDPVDGKARTQVNGGTVSASAGTLLTLSGYSATSIELGQFAGSWVTQDVDEMALWNRALTSDERAELYNAGAGKFYPFT